MQCSKCPAGSYCPKTNMTEPFVCSSGHSCQESSAPRPCPNGTYMHASKGGLQSLDECAWCPAGASCTGTGLAAPSGGCAAGILCSLGSKDDQGKGNTCGTPTPCPAGHYCEADVARATPCPKGTWASKEGLKNRSQCEWCPAGRSVSHSFSAFYCRRCTYPGAEPTTCLAS